MNKWGNYLAAALRNLARNRLYAAINIVGLAVGFAAAILIGLFVRDELSYDRFIPDHERTFQLGTVIDVPGRAPMVINSSLTEVPALMRQEFPSVEAIARLLSTSIALRRGEVESFETGAFWADPNIFDLLPLPSIAGDLRSALQRPDSVVITRAIARKYFGRDTPIGEVLEVNRANSMVVTAVLEDLPSNTHLNLTVVASGRATISQLAYMDAQPRATTQGGTGSSAFTYLRLAQGASIDELRQAFPAFVERYLSMPKKKFGLGFELTAIPLADVHLHAHGTDSMKPPGDLNTLYAATAIALLILFLAGVNFVNLMTARATQRALEVGIRKVSGATRADLVWQFIGESLIYVVCAAVLAVALVEHLLPTFNAFLDRGIVFDYWRTPLFGVTLILVGLVLAVLAGLYPAFVLASFRPASVFSTASNRSGASGTVRQILVICQFAILIGITLSAVVIHRQMMFALHESLRLDSDKVLLVFNSCSNAFAAEARKLPGVRAAACSTGLPLRSEQFELGSRSGAAPVTLYAGTVDFDFLDFYGVRPVAGRFFSRTHTTDAFPRQDTADFDPPIVINETAARAFGFATPADAVGVTISLSSRLRSNWRPQIIGVAPDFPVGSIRETIDPLFLFVHPLRYQAMSLRLEGRDIPATLTAIDRLWKQTGNDHPIVRSFLDRDIEELYRDVSRQTRIFTTFSVIAVFIACLGLFGLSTFLAVRRTKEIGIRKALGANRGTLLRLLLWDFARPVLWATLIAWPAGYLLMSRWLDGFAYRIDPQPWMFVAASGAALLIALLTVFAHALAVVRARPVTALHHD